MSIKNNEDIALKVLLASTQKKLAEVESVAKIGTWEYILSTHEVFWSDQMFKIFDRKPELGNPTFADVHERIHYADRFQWELLINKVSIDGEPVEIVIRLLDTKDEVRWIKKTATGVFERSELIAIRGFCQDVTELKRLETHYELTREFFEGEG
jgi:PAS domain-containing protein